MTNAFSTQAAALGLAAFVTMGVLFGLNGLAAGGFQAAHTVSAQATQVVPATQPG